MNQPDPASSTWAVPSPTTAPGAPPPSTPSPQAGPEAGAVPAQAAPDPVGSPSPGPVGTVESAAHGPSPRRPGLLVGAAAAVAVLMLGGHLATAALHRGDVGADTLSADGAPQNDGGQGPLGGGGGFGDGHRHGDVDGDDLPFDGAEPTLGIVASTGSDTVVLRTRENATVTVRVTDSTTVRRVSGQGTVAASLSELGPGDLVLVQGEPEAGGSYQADGILLAPRRPAERPGGPGAGAGSGSGSGPGSGPDAAATT